MPVLLVLAIVAFVVATIGLVVFNVVKVPGPPTVVDDEDYRSNRERASWESAHGDAWFFHRGIKYFSLVMVALGFLLMFFSSITTVSTKHVAVVTSFGSPTGSVLPNGLHLKLPWEKKAEFDAAIQVDSYGDKTGGNTDAAPIQVKIVNQATGDVHVTVRWRISTDAADELFQDYRTFDNVRASLVSRELRATLNDVFAGYDALGTVATLDADGNEVTAEAPTYAELSKDATDALRERVNGQVEILGVDVSFVALDGATQGRVNGLQEEVGNTRVAEQRQATAEAEAEANRILAESVSNDPNVLVSDCMRFLRTAVERGQELPDGFSCWPGGTAPFTVTN